MAAVLDNAMRQWRADWCQHSLGSSAANRVQDDFGRLEGPG